MAAQVGNDALTRTLVLINRLGEEGAFTKILTRPHNIPRVLATAMLGGTLTGYWAMTKYLQSRDKFRHNLLSS